jgi:hypothetical protein
VRTRRRGSPIPRRTCGLVQPHPDRYAVKQFRRHRAGRNDCGADIVRLHFLAQSFGKGAHPKFGSRINRETRSDLMAGHGRHIDEMPGFLLPHIRQRGGCAVQHAFAVHVDRPIPLVDFEALERRLWHQPGIIDHHINPPTFPHRRVHQILHHMRAVGDVGCHGHCLAAAGNQLARQRLDAILSPRVQHDVRALCGKRPGGRLAQPAAGASDNSTLSLIPSLITKSSTKKWPSAVCVRPPPWGSGRLLR